MSKKPEEPDAGQDKEYEEYKKDKEYNKNAQEFVELLFKGDNSTEDQNSNLIKLTKKLNDNSNTSLWYIYKQIKEFVYNVDNEKYEKKIERCYKSLNDKSNTEDDVPFYFKEIKNINSNFYYKIVFIFQIIYENKINTQNFDRIIELLNKNKELLCSHIEKTKKCKEEEDKKINDIENKINKMKAEILDGIKDKIYPEIITILGIFTAITFAIFGGMNLLSNLFQNMRSTHASLGQALILASVFGFTLWGLLEILFIWISKINLTKDDKDDKKEKKIDKKEKIFNWSALSFLTVILIFGFALFFF